MFCFSSEEPSLCWTKQERKFEHSYLVLVSCDTATKPSPFCSVIISYTSAWCLRWTGGSLGTRLRDTFVSAGLSTVPRRQQLLNKVFIKWMNEWKKKWRKLTGATSSYHVPIPHSMLPMLRSSPYSFLNVPITLPKLYISHVHENTCFLKSGWSHT